MHDQIEFVGKIQEDDGMHIPYETARKLIHTLYEVIGFISYNAANIKDEHESAQAESLLKEVIGITNNIDPNDRFHDLGSGKKEKIINSEDTKISNKNEIPKN